MLRPGAAVRHTSQAVVRVVGGEEADLVTLGGQLEGEGLDMAPNSTWIRVRVGRYERYTHLGNSIGDTSGYDGRSKLRQIHLPEGRPGLAPALGRGAGLRQARIRRCVRGFRRGALPARVLAGGHPGRLRPDGAGDGAHDGAHPRAPRAAEPERADAIRGRAVLVSRDDEGVALLRRARQAARPACGGGLEVPDRLPDVEEARLVPAARGGAHAGDAGAHRGGAAVHWDRDE